MTNRNNPINELNDPAEEFVHLMQNMEAAIRDGIPGASALLDRTEPDSNDRQELIQDLMRGATIRYPVHSILKMLQDLGGWNPENVTKQNLVGTGDHLCDIEISGEHWPCIIFGAAATPFDDDPLLTCMTGHLRSNMERACLIHPHPIFQAQGDREGHVTRFVLFGGWLIDDDMCRPFCLDGRGEESLPEQTKFFRTPRISRGFFRDRGHDADQLNLVLNTQAEIDAASAKASEAARAIMSPEGSSTTGAKGDKAQYTIATGQDEWCYFITREMAEQVTELQDMLAGTDIFGKGY